MALLLAGWLVLSSLLQAPASALAPTRSGAAGPVAREVYSWQPVAIGAGGFITGQNFDASGATHLARTDVFGAYLWSQRHDRWVQLVTADTMPIADQADDALTGGVYEVVAAPSRPDRLYMAVRRALYRSDDCGRHFVRAGQRPLDLNPNGEYRTTGPFIAVSPNDPDLVLFSTQKEGVWRSSDAGRTWTRLTEADGGEAGRPALVWFAPGSKRAWIMVQERGMLVSTDPTARRFVPAANTAKEHPRLLRRGAFDRAGTFYGADQEGRAVWRHDDAGWTRLTVSLGKDPLAIGSVAVDPRDDGVYAFTPFGRSFRSGDRGGHWWPMPRRVADADTNEPPWLVPAARGSFPVADVLADPAVPGRLWASTGVAPYRSDPPPGKLWLTWNSQARGIEELVATGIAHPPGGVPSFTAWDFGIHTRDNLDRYSQTWGPKPRILIAAQNVAWSAGHPSAMVTNASDTRQCCAEDGEAVLAGYSRDGGATWKRFATLPVPPGTKAGDPWAMSYGTIAVSSGNPDTVIWLPAANRSPFFTKDNGATWQRVALPGEVLPFTGSYDRFPYIRRTLVADPMVRDRFLMLHSGEGANGALRGLWRTEDGGAHWTRILNGEIMPGSGYSAKLRAMPGVRDSWFFTNAQRGTGDTTLRRSRDGGKTWQTIPGVTEVADVAFGKAAPGASTSAIYVAARVAGRRGVWRSVDDARTWQMIAGLPLGRLDVLGTVAADPDRFGRVYLSYQGSGWIYGEPARCKPAPSNRDAAAECFAVKTPIGGGRAS